VIAGVYPTEFPEWVDIVAEVVGQSKVISRHLAM
jgi:hypothetical protein